MFTLATRGWWRRKWQVMWFAPHIELFTKISFCSLFFIIAVVMYYLGRQQLNLTGTLAERVKLWTNVLPVMLTERSFNVFKTLAQKKKKTLFRLLGFFSWNALVEGMVLVKKLYLGYCFLFFCFLKRVSGRYGTCFREY